jgi:hypothetical protein
VQKLLYEEEQQLYGTWLQPQELSRVASGAGAAGGAYTK